MSKHNPKSVPGNLMNVPTSPDGPFWQMYPTTHVTCALCGAKIRRRKFDQHLATVHPDFDGDLAEAPPLEKP